ncbi:MAG: 50S ribosomal protein L21 [Alphaproteobacteria bacterium]|nr:50S ribosomal protein L21 [Alphaproteobacteria bacterium]
MFAVIKTGGKQYRVAAGDEIVVEKIDGEPGASVSFSDVLMVADGAKVTVGAPRVAGASVTGELVATAKGEKVVVFKKRRRSTYRRKNGHRQLESTVKITAIQAG